MINYAILSGNLVTNTIVCDDENIDSISNSYVKITEDTKAASIGMIYDNENNKFISQKPYDSWILNDNFDWESPLGPNPDILTKIWDEITQDWVDRF